MLISKHDALAWFEFFAELPEDEPLPPRQQELALATLSQIEMAEAARIGALKSEIPGLKSLNGRTCYVGDDARFPKGCRSCLLGTGLSAIRKTNRCNLRCPFCYDYGEMEDQPPIGEGYWEIGGTRCREEDIGLLLSASACWWGGRPSPSSSWAKNSNHCRASRLEMFMWMLPRFVIFGSGTP